MDTLPATRTPSSRHRADASIKPGEHLSPAESARLAELEPIIERGLTTFVEVGTALIEISHKRLYRQTHSSFKDYCQERWNMTPSRAYQLCDAAEVIKSLPPELSTMVDTERQARELARAPASERVEIVKEVAKGGLVTAKNIKVVVQKRHPKAVEVVAEAAKLKHVEPEREDRNFECDSCGERFDTEDEAVTLYECGDCGDRFTQENSADSCSHRCPGCNKFGAKVSDMGCPECGAGELNEIKPEARQKAVASPPNPPPSPGRTIALAGASAVVAVGLSDRLRQVSDTLEAIERDQSWPKSEPDLEPMVVKVQLDTISKVLQSLIKRLNKMLSSREAK